MKAESVWLKGHVDIDDETRKLEREEKGERGRMGERKKGRN